MDMFCFQCEQTSHGKACQLQGVCGKKAQTANLQDLLNSKIIALASTNQPSEQLTKLIIDGLFTTITNVNYDDLVIQGLVTEVESFSNNQLNTQSAFAIAQIWNCPEDVRSLKSLIFFGLKGIAAYAHHAWILGYKDTEVNSFFYEGLKAIAATDLTTDELLKIVLKTGGINLKCMDLLDKANTETFGHPIPTTVSTSIEKKPFIIITGHDLRDLQLLLEQTKDSGINIYTHGEMLPCHAYPVLKKHPHLRGNFGTAWQNQQHEFANVPAAILFTTNCLMLVQDSYKDRVFTTSVVGYPNIAHIDENKDFTPVIKKALELGGYNEFKKATGINGGEVLTVGYAHNSVLNMADKIVTAIKSGKIKHIFLVGGCDGAKLGRNYYTEFVKKTPKNTIILTLACGKYRFNDLDLGSIEGIPRLLDIGQCNDVYSAVKIMIALAKVFDCGVNQLPISLILSWYEQKAVAILLTLLHLGIENMRLGPSLPAFVSPNILNILVSKFKIQPITTADEDLRAILGVIE